MAYYGNKAGSHERAPTTVKHTRDLVTFEKNMAEVKEEDVVETVIRMAPQREITTADTCRRTRTGALIMI